MGLLYKIFFLPFVQMAAAPDLLVQTLWEGLVGGVLYALIALGYVLIYKASGVFNFAQGIMVVFAALTLVGLHELGVPAFVALVLALAVGISLEQIWVIVWFAAGIVALATGIMWGARSNVSFALEIVALKALPVLVLGGFTSVPGAIVGGVIIGVSEKLGEFYWGPLLGGGIENWLAYVIALVFLLFRPQGLFGEKIIERV